MKFLRTLAIGAAFGAALAGAPAAFADAKSEAFVETNSNRVLEVLNDDALTDEQRSARFSEFMHTFANIPAIARRVLGPAGRSLSQEEFDAYYDAFQRYAIAVYEVQLDQFRGEEVKVIGSRDIDERRSQVRSLIESSQAGRDIEVIWDVIRSEKDPTKYQVRDVGLNLDGTVLWLAQDQQAQFEAFLGRNNNDVGRLVARINQMTASLEAKKQAGGATAKGKG
jgi:phospholipid transport system substrate-binding protein